MDFAIRAEQLEAWVLSLVDQVANGARVEDSRVELKADWPDPRKAARRIAGHANASGGDAVLWIIGLDEQRGVMPVPSIDIASWRAQVAAEFDGVDPSLRDLAVPTAAGTLIALLFDTSRRPYVVKNPAFGTTGAGPVSLEVPWRSGTAVRSARREELLRILVPLQKLPFVELLSASASTARQEAVHPGYGGSPSAVQRSEHIAWSIRLNLYVTPRTSDLLVLPVHKAALTFRHGNAPSVIAAKVSLYTPSYDSGTASFRDSHTITTTSSEAVLTGPGKLYAEGSHYESVRPLPSQEGLEVLLSLTPAGHDRAVQVTTRLLPAEDEGQFKRSWMSESSLESA